MADGPQIPSQTQILHDSDQSMTSLDLELSQPLSFSSSCSHDEPEISVPNSPNLNRALLTPSSHGPQTSLITKGRIIPHLQPHHKEAEDTFRLASEYICELATHASDEPRLVIEEVCIAETQNAALELAQAHSVLDSAVRRTTRSSLSAEVSRSQTISATVKSELISPKPAKRRPRKREQKPSQNITPVSKRLRTLELRASKNLFSSITFLLTGFSGSAHTEERTRLIAFIESLGGRVGRTDTVDDCVSLSDPLDSLPRIVIMNGSRRNWSTKIFYTLLRGDP
uniref:BRCT domain-containing protein n=1 Tax=Spongospora subterranea TaxID=70186 RepID=A0A0H5QVW5_9EUKA|eukprot:CRZ06128.1 hypothetical protein [Spongospora subterranea]